MRIRNWVAQQVLSGAADAALITAINRLKLIPINDSLKAWHTMVEDGPNVFHSFAYVHNLSCDTGGRPLEALINGDVGQMARVVRDQCEPKNAPKVVTWYEYSWDGGTAWRAHYANYWYGFDPNDTIHPPAILPGIIYPDSIKAYQHGILVLNDHDRYTREWQNYTIGYGSDASGGGRGIDQLLQQWSHSCYDNTPAIPLYFAPWVMAEQFPVAKWFIDSMEWVYFLQDTGIYSTDVADSLACHKADSLYADSIIIPYLKRHTDSADYANHNYSNGIYWDDSVEDNLWASRFPTASELPFQFWEGITHGLKGTLLNIVGDDGIEQHGLVTGESVKSQDRTNIGDADGSFWIGAQKINGRWYPGGLGTRQFGSYPDNYAGLGGAIGHSDTLNQHWDVPNMRLPLPSWYRPLFNVMRGDMIELNQLAPTLAKLSWLGTVSWPWRDSTPIYLSRLPVKNVTSKNLSGIGYPITYIDLGIHKDAADSLAMYCSVLNRLLWTDSTGTDHTDTRTITMHVRDSAFNSFYINWPAWEITNKGTGWDTVVGLDSNFSITLGAGRGAMLRIAPSISETIGKLTTNVWNNARHIAYNETNFDTAHRYWMVYERKGNIYARDVWTWLSLFSLHSQPLDRSLVFLLGWDRHDQCVLKNSEMFYLDFDGIKTL